MAQPNVKIYQESSASPVAVITAIQELLIVGPAYHIEDYAADKNNLLIGEYGVKDAACSTTTGSNVSRPLPGASVITIADPPNNSPGAILDSASVVAYIDTVYLEIGNTNRLDGTAETTAPDENIFYAAAGGYSFNANGVRPGDRLVITDTGGVGGTLIKTVKEVGGYNGSLLTENQLRTYSNLTLGGALTVPQNGSYRFRVERVLNDLLLDSNFVSVVGNTVTIKGGATVSVDIDGDGTIETPLLNYAQVYIQYRSLRQDLALVTQINDATQIESLVGLVDERNPMSVALQVAYANTTSTINFFCTTGDDLNGASDLATAHAAALAFIDSNDSIYCIVPLSRDITIAGLYRTAALALSAPDSAIYRIIIAAIDDLPTTSVVAATSAGTAELLAGDPISVFATADGDFLNAGLAKGDHLFMQNDIGPYTVDLSYDAKRVRLNETHAEAAGDANFFWFMRDNGANPHGGSITDHGLVELDGNAGNKVNVLDVTTLDADRIGQVMYLNEAVGLNTYVGYWLINSKTNGVLANIAVGADLTFYSRVRGPSGNGTSLTFNDPGANSPLSVSTGANAIVVTLAYAAGAVTSTAQEVKDAIEANAIANGLVSMTITGNPLALQVDSVGAKLTANGVYAFYIVVGGGNAFPGGAPAAPSYAGLVRSVKQSITAAGAVTWRRSFRQLLDVGGTFLSGLTPAIVGDNLETPIPAGAGNSDFTGSLSSWPIEKVLSDNRVKLDVKADIPVGSYLAIIDSTADFYRITRDLSPTLQVDAVNAATLPLASEQFIRVAPPSVTGVEGVVNALTGASSEQGGEYLAAAVGALISTLPVQQSLTRRPIAGITGLKFSNSYFTRGQIKDLAAGGNLLITQQPGGAPPTIFHQTTTSTTLLEGQELSMVRCKHYVLSTLRVTFDQLIADYNAIPSTASTLEDTMRAVLSSIKSDYLPKLGAPLADYGDIKINFLEGSLDTAELRGYLKFPAPLNVIVFRLVA